MNWTAPARDESGYLFKYNFPIGLHNQLKRIEFYVFLPCIVG